MAAPSVTYTFTNGTTADATQVNTNYTDLINGASDGTKDYTINSLTCNGNFTFSGTGTFGSASGDDLTFNGSIASSIPVKTNATYDIGGSTTGLAGVYLGNNTRTVRLVAGTLTGTYTITLPVAAPTKTGMMMTFDTNALATFRFANKLTASKTGAYTATSDETVIPCDASGGAFTVTLPAVSGNSGMILTIKKTDTSFNAVTIDGDGSETIGGATTTTLNTEGESIQILCDGSAWLIINRHIPSVWSADFAPTLNSTTNVSARNAHWRRVGDSIEFRVNVNYSGAGHASTFSVTLPNSFSIDSSKIPSTASASRVVGPAGWDDASASFVPGGTIVLSTTTVGIRVNGSSGAFASNTAASGDILSLTAVLPISGWNA